MARTTELVEVSVSKLVPYAKNAKIHGEEQVAKIAASINEFGFVSPCLIDKENNIIAGHGRVLAAKSLGMSSVPCVYVEGLTDEQRRAYILADNRLTELGEWDMDIVGDELAELDELGFDVSLTGFDFEIDDPEIVDDNYEEPETIEPRAKRGDIYQLGDHRLMCGDSTEASDVAELMEGSTADVLLTDPPYGIDIVNTAGNLNMSPDRMQKGQIGGDKPFGSQKGVVGFGEKGKNKILNCTEYLPIKGDETTDTARSNYEIMREYSKAQILFGGNYFTDFLPPSRCWVVWDKQNSGNFADAELAWTSYDRGVRLYQFMWNGLIREGDRKTEGVKRIHPTQKPVGLMGKIIIDFTKPGDIIADTFGGSGSTLIACEQLGRKCYMLEYEPTYVDLIIDRWEKFTGKKAVLING